MSGRELFNHLLAKLTGTGKSDPVRLVHERFLTAFNAHGIETSQIPRVFPELKLLDLTGPEKLLAVLTPEIIDKTSKLFGIRTEWLEGVDDQIYEYLGTYKDPKIVLEHISSLRSAIDEEIDFPLRVLVTDKHLRRESQRIQYLVPVLVEPIFELGEELICRYHVYRDGFSWGYPPARIELKAIARTVFCSLHSPVPLFQISEHEMDELLEGRAMPRSLMRGALISNPSLEDYALAPTESRVAKETDELPEVLKLIQEHGLTGYSSKQKDSASSATKGKPSTDLPTSADWTDAARSIADELDAQDAKCNAHDSLRSIAERVALEMRKRKIYGPRGPVSNATVLREALQGGKWARKQ